MRLGHKQGVIVSSCLRANLPNARMSLCPLPEVSASGSCHSFFLSFSACSPSGRLPPELPPSGPPLRLIAVSIRIAVSFGRGRGARSPLQLRVA